MPKLSLTKLSRHHRLEHHVRIFLAYFPGPVQQPQRFRRGRGHRRPVLFILGETHRRGLLKKQCPALIYDTGLDFSEQLFSKQQRLKSSLNSGATYKDQINIATQPPNKASAVTEAVQHAGVYNWLWGPPNIYQQRRRHESRRGTQTSSKLDFVRCGLLA
ncbi:hypothetical protein FZEAL_6636 [Fusarium zealandicum]|uniref:Uncharacterized protein n=1 Tax=Fusarium zealandicum TaxID=1053134 RepID=A0A8H4UI54_9HYPO|nr:hypothetical protein FZEAL_6636 [Fusarium zealandicum]